MTAITLTRTGRRPLSFEGELVAESSSRHSGGREQTRWHRLRLYRAAGSGTFVLAIAYRTRWEGELDRDIAVECATADEVEAALTAFNPTEYLAGYPVGDQFRPKQERLIRSITAAYDQAVSELLTDLPEKLRGTT